jgi:hypothetical protein
MKYLCLAYYDEKKFETLGPADMPRSPRSAARSTTTCGVPAGCSRSARSRPPETP